MSKLFVKMREDESAGTVTMKVSVNLNELIAFSNCNEGDVIFDFTC